MGYVTLILSIISIILSCVVAWTEYKRDYRINKTNLNAYYFNEIYRDHLINSIPTARKYITIGQENKPVGIEMMIDEMKSIQNASLYYRYSDREYFEKLKSVSQEIEDFLINSRDKTYVGEDQTDYYNNIQKMLDSLYEIINKKYLS